MLRRSFEIFSGIGPKTQAKILDAGITSWDDALQKRDRLPFPAERSRHLSEEIEEALRRYNEGDTLYFAQMLKPKDSWRLFSSFAERCIYFDIETTGLSAQTDDLTLICTYDPCTQAFSKYVRGENLDSFPESIQQGAVLIGFNSRGFDLPFIRGHFGRTLPDLADIDVRWILHAMDIRGPLKHIEQNSFGVKRPASIEGFGGEEAVQAWYDWEETRDQSILENLIKYCSADAFVLDFMIRETCRRYGCERFRDPILPSRLFHSDRITDWPSTIPPLPSRGDDKPKHRPQPPPLAGTRSSELQDDEPLNEGESCYHLVYAMALADEIVTHEERNVLDLFAIMNGLSTRQKEMVETRARAHVKQHGLAGIGNLILKQGYKRALRELEQLIMFSFVDGHLDKRESKLILALARKLKLTQDQLDEMRRRGVARGRELTMRLK